MMNTIIEKQLENVSKERIDSIINSFYAGCTKYDLYELATKYNNIRTSDLYTFQQVLNNPRLTTEEYVQTLQNIPSNSVGSDNSSNSTGADSNVNINGSSSNTTISNPQLKNEDFKKYVGYGFYFHNDLPDP